VLWYIRGWVGGALSSWNTYFWIDILAIMWLYDLMLYLVSGRILEVGFPLCYLGAPKVYPRSSS